MNLFRSGCSVFGGVSVRTRFFVFVAAKVGVDDGVDEPENGNPLR